MKPFYFIPGLAVAAVLSAGAEPAVVDGIKGVVSSSVVTFSEVEDYSRPAADALRRQYADQPDVFQQKLNDTLNDSLNQLVENALILKSFDTEGYKLPDAVVDELVQERIRERFGDRITFMKTLQAQGMTVEQFRKQVRGQYIEAALRNQNVQREIFISPYQIENYYQSQPGRIPRRGPGQTAHDRPRQVRAGRHQHPQARARNPGQAQGRRAVRRDGRHLFAGLAAAPGRRLGLGPTIRPPQGACRHRLRPAPGTVSDLVDTPDTCYLMLVEEKHAATSKPLTEVAADIEKTLRLKQQAKLQKNWIEGLKKKTFIRYF